MSDLTRVEFERGDLRLDIVLPNDRFVALVGPNGAGKTTVLRCLGGLEATATVTWSQREPSTFGYLPQRTSLYPAMSLLDNVASSLRFDGVGRAAAVARATEMLELLGIAELARKRPHQVSGGQRQRAGLARAIVAVPELVLLDEPFSAIDVASRQSVRERVIEQIASSGARCVIATHDQDDVVASAAASVEIA